MCILVLAKNLKVGTAQLGQGGPFLQNVGTTVPTNKIHIIVYTLQQSTQKSRHLNEIFYFKWCMYCMYLYTCEMYQQTPAPDTDSSTGSAGHPHRVPPPRGFTRCRREGLF